MSINRTFEKRNFIKNIESELRFIQATLKWDLADRFERINFIGMVDDSLRKIKTNLRKLKKEI